MTANARSLTCVWEPLCRDRRAAATHPAHQNKSTAFCSFIETVLAEIRETESGSANGLLEGRTFRLKAAQMDGTSRMEFILPKVF